MRGTETKPGGDGGLISRRETRRNRRIQEAQELANSRFVTKLKSELKSSNHDAVITVTEPNGHPLAHVSIQAVWNIRRETIDIFDNDMGGYYSTTAWIGDSIELTLPKSRRNRGKGLYVKSNKGREFVPNSMNSNEMRAVIKSAIENPMNFAGRNEPGTEPHRRII